MSNKSISKNFIYNLMLQILTLGLPLITVPYISRVLGTDGVGINSYTNSIVQYFILFGSLGISMYGNREIAYTRDDKEKMSKTFWSILLLKFFTLGISLILYILIFGTSKKYGYIYLIQSINILAAIIDISWLYAGLEDFKKTVTRNMIVKILCVIAMFMLVKKKQDLYLYVLFNSLMNFGGNLTMWAYLPKTVVKIKVTIKDIKRHFIPNIKLFIPQIAIQVYTLLDKTMIGILTTESQVGLYEQSEKIVKMILGLVTSLGTVMLPRMSNIFANGNKLKMKKYLNLSLKGVSFVSIPMAIGLAGISKEFVPWFFGNEFKDVIYLMTMLTPILIFIAISNVFGIQYLMPSNRTNEFTMSVSISAFINFTLNLILIPRYKALGACISTVIAEFSVTLVQYIFVRHEIEKKKYMVSFIKYIFAACMMFFVVRLIGINLGVGILTTIIQGIVGMVIYELILLILKEEFNLIMINKLKNKFIKQNYR